MQENKIKSLQRDLFNNINIIKYILLIILTLIYSGLFVVSPILLNQKIGDSELLNFKDIGLVVCLFVLGYMIEFASVFVKNGLVQDFNSKAIATVYREVFKLSYDSYLERGKTNLQEYPYKVVDSYSDYYFDFIPSFISDALIILSALIVSFTISPLKWYEY